jgi:hypothetical protein
MYIFPMGIAGHYRNNPWPAVSDWRRCRNADTGLMMRINGKTNDAGLTFSPAFRYSDISIFIIAKMQKTLRTQFTVTI